MICLYKERKISFNVWYVVLSIVPLFSAFIVYYYANTEIDDLDRFLQFVLRHFYFYLTSGILPLGEISCLGYPNEEPFILPFINIINTWVGNEGTVAHSTIWVITDMSLETNSNVFTFFGTLLMGKMYFPFLCYSILFGAISATIFLKSQRVNNLFIAIMNGYNLSVLFFGWFNCGYGLLRIWEIFLISSFLYILSYRVKCKFIRS